MNDNECIVYCETDGYTHLDMLIATYLRFFLEKDDIVGLTAEKINDILYTDSLKGLIKDCVLNCDEDGLYNTCLDFKAQRNFVSITIPIA